MKTYFQLGQTVYRTDFNIVEQGKVIDIERVTVDAGGNIYADPNGEHQEYTAEFSNGFQLSQLFPYLFFENELDAYNKLATTLDKNIRKLEKQKREKIKELAQVEQHIKMLKIKAA